jgi:hypothetical protein
MELLECFETKIWGLRVLLEIEFRIEGTERNFCVGMEILECYEMKT